MGCFYCYKPEKAHRTSATYACNAHSQLFGKINSWEGGGGKNVFANIDSGYLSRYKV